MIGRVTDEVRLLVFGRDAVWGLLVEPVAATIGDAAFVDLTAEKDGLSAFAGKENISRAELGQSLLKSVSS